MQDKTVLVTGATGFIGSCFCRSALKKGFRVIALSRDPVRAKSLLPDMRLVQALEDIALDEPVDYVVNLAGEPLVAGRWNAQRKQTFLDSRVGLTEQLYHHFQQAKIPPRVMVSGSAVGYYGPHHDRVLDEAGKHHDSFSHRLCAAWEASASRFELLGTRVCYLRTGIVLGQGGGALARMLPPFRLGLGGRLGTGKQWMPWIHLNDEVAIIFHCLKRSDIHGSVNAVSPNPVTNRQFTKALGKAVHRPALFPMPALVAKLLFGEMAEELLLTGQRAVPRKLLESGYRFRFPELSLALSEILGNGEPEG
ncbi:MAG: TIGR01777 family protein [Gammaproteobacteria bacterium]|nr:MAG: TIGR01777 family protein [Gammaproteobacteria bacterium]